MGSPKRARKKYSKPSHPWQKERIEEEKALLREYGLKNKKEIWRAASLLKKFTSQAKSLIIETSVQAEVEKKQLLKKLYSLGLVEEGAKLEDVLSINVKNILDRRLQTLISKKKLARSIQQARQFVIHRHVLIGDNKITMPSYLVSREEEAFIGFISKSPFFNQDHPERAEQAVVKQEKPKKKATKKTKEKEPKGGQK